MITEETIKNLKELRQHIYNTREQEYIVWNRFGDENLILEEIMHLNDSVQKEFEYVLRVKGYSENDIKRIEKQIYSEL